MAEIPVTSTLHMDRSEPLGNSDDGTGAGRRALHVLNKSAIVSKAYDAGTVAYPDALTEIYTYHTGTIAGPIVATLTVVYTDSTKEFIASWARTYP